MNVYTTRHTMSNLSFGYPISVSKPKYQPVRIPITDQNSDSKNPASNRKRNGLSMFKPVRILQTPTETKKPPVRKRLDMMYESGKSIANRKSTIARGLKIDPRDPYNNNSVVLHEASGSSTSANNHSKRSKLIQPGTIKNDFIRKSSIMLHRKEGVSVPNLTAASHNKSIRHSDIPEESSQLFDTCNEKSGEKTEPQERSNVLNQERIQKMVNAPSCSKDIDNENGIAQHNSALSNSDKRIPTKEQDSDEMNPADRAKSNTDQLRPGDNYLKNDSNAETQRPSVIVTLKPKSPLKSKLDCCKELLGSLGNSWENGNADKPSQMSESIHSTEVKCLISFDTETLVALELCLNNCIQTQEMHLRGLRDAMATVQLLLNANKQSNVTDLKKETTKQTGPNRALTLTPTNQPHTNSPNRLHQANRYENITPSPELQRLPDDFESDLPEYPDIHEQANKSATQENELVEEGFAEKPDSFISLSIGNEVSEKENHQKLHKRNTLVEITLNGNSPKESNENQPPGRRRSARIANKQLTASASPKGGLANNNKLTTSKSKPCTPRAGTARYGKGNIRTETPLREYMLLKSVNKFLVTPDTRPRQSGLDGRLVNENNYSRNTNLDQTLLSQKLLKSLQKLYVATP